MGRRWEQAVQGQQLVLEAQDLQKGHQLAPVQRGHQINRPPLALEQEERRERTLQWWKASVLFERKDVKCGC